MTKEEIVARRVGHMRIAIETTLPFLSRIANDKEAPRTLRMEAKARLQHMQQALTMTGEELETKAINDFMGV